MNARKNNVKTTCLINNYNYASFLPEAVNSALNQSIKFDEIIIVDDASTDSSVEVITELAKNTNIKYLLKKENQGQLSSFNEGFLAATGDIIFFLDADDIYDSQYLEQALNIYQHHQECDFIFCAYQKFGAAEGIFQKAEFDLDLGYSVIKTLYLGEWIGSITSTLSMRKAIAEKILPIPYTEDWRVRADDCLIWSSSLVGAKKFYLAQPLIKYRIHANNHFGNSKFADFNYSFEYKRIFKRSVMFNYIMAKNNITPPLLLAYTSILELKTIPYPKTIDFISYLKIIFIFETNIYWRLKGIYFLFVYFCQTLIHKKLTIS